MYLMSVFQYICVLNHSKGNLCFKLSHFVTLYVCFMPELSFMCVLCLFEQKLLDWINHVLTNEGIIVMNIEEDLFDGQILQKLIGENLPPPPVKYCEIIHFHANFHGLSIFRSGWVQNTVDS